MNDYNESVAAHIFHNSENLESQTTLALIKMYSLSIVEELPIILNKIFTNYFKCRPSTKIIEAHGIRFITKKY